MKISRPLGELEMEVMKTLWARGSATGKEIWEDIRTSRKTALTTVLTVVDRLWRKKMISKTKEESLLVFGPLISKDEYTKEMSGRIFSDYLSISSSSLIASFVNTLEKVGPEELDKLSDYINKKKKEKRYQGLS
ncbi:hypothetical protein MNBD_NITROSPINAE02-995 [hydrothermal vent metagenome]|uniref:Penicillinase repressor n=1 Tax=hydrothermal vent metagenome TaxID=652676 RepID=A0A3B1D3K6_9ZZZZ